MRKTDWSIGETGHTAEHNRIGNDLNKNDRNYCPKPILTLMSGSDDEVAGIESGYCTPTIDETNYKIGQRAWRATTAGSVSANIRLPFSPHYELSNGGQAIGIWFYVEDATKITGALTVTLATAADYSTNWVRSTAHIDHTIVTGWNFCRWSAISGGITGWGTIYRAMVSFSTTEATYITVGHLWIEISDKAKMIVVWDGAQRSFFEHAYPLFKERRIPITNAVTSTFILDTNDPLLHIDINELIEFASENRNAVSLHSASGILTNDMTESQVREDCAMGLKWLAIHGFIRGREWRAAWWQNLCPNHAVAQDYFLCYATPVSAAGARCWPHRDKWNIPRTGMMNRTDSYINQHFDVLRTTHGFSVIYFHGIEDDNPMNTSFAQLGLIMQNIDLMIDDGVIEFVTMDELLARDGYKFSQSLDGDISVEYIDNNGDRAVKRLF